MTAPRSETIAALTHGTYLVQPPRAEGQPAGLVVGFHGYGETAERHLAELARIPGSERWLLSAVQGLHLFYTRSGEVVASWMTRANREQAIVDNVRYAASVVARLRAEAPRVPLVYAGFSQGVAMAYRAAALGGFRPHGLVALGGDVPPELAELDLRGFPPVLLGRGDGEEWYDEGKLAKDLELLRDKGVDVRPVAYVGGHEWTDEFRRAAGRFLDEVAGS